MAKLNKASSALTRVLIVVALAIVVGAIVLAKNNSGGRQDTAPDDYPPSAIPKIVDLGARKCIPYCDIGSMVSGSSVPRFEGVTIRAMAVQVIAKICEQDLETS